MGRGSILKRLSSIDSKRHNVKLKDLFNKPNMGRTLFGENKEV